MTDSSTILTKVRQRRISELLIRDKRLDGRGLTDYRKIEVETDTIEKALGSAHVSIGNTKVMTGVKIELGEPFPDTPENGVLITNVELVPLASPTFEPGPPKENAIELARVVDRGLRESKAIDLKKLCLIPGKKVLVVFVDIYVLDHDGNLFDASALASIIAIANAKMPVYTVKEDGELEAKPDYVQLPIQNRPIAITMAKIDDKLIVDPSLDEETVVDTQITMAIGDNGEVCAIQKRGAGTLSVETVFEAYRIAREKAGEMRKKFRGMKIG